MGRIEEALRRSGKTQRQSSSEATAVAKDVFASPWGFRDGSPERLADGTDQRGLAVQAPAGQVRRIRSFSDAWMERLVSGPAADALLVEQFRQLAATLHQAQTTSQIKIVMVTSAEPNEGKSFTAMNLALTLSESYRRRVLLIDGDLRRPSLHEIAQVPNVSGLGEALKSTSDQKVTVFEISDKLMLVPAGRPDRNPMSALTSPRMQQILQDAAVHFDWVFIDAPPVGPIADSTLLAPIADATLLVIRAGQAQYPAVQKAVDAIGRDRILGVVLNGADHIEAAGYRRYYAAYLPEPMSAD
jgi:capsular exopolysaccharide synthesis family protein